MLYLNESISKIREEKLLQLLQTRGPLTRDQIEIELSDISSSAVDRVIRSLISNDKIVTLPGESSTHRRGPPKKLYALKDSETLQSEILSRQLIRNFLENNGWGSVTDIATSSSLTYTAIWHELQKMLKIDLVRQVGEQRNETGQSGAIYGLTTKVTSGEIPADLGILLSQREQDVLNIIRRYGPISSVDIASTLNIRKDALKVTINNLMLMGYIEAADIGYPRTTKKSHSARELYISK